MFHKIHAFFFHSRNIYNLNIIIIKIKIIIQEITTINLF